MTRCISIDSEIFPQFKGLQVAFFTCETPRPYANDEEQLLAQNDIIQTVKSHFSTREQLAEHAFSEAYAKFYRAMGLKPKKVSTPIQQSLRVFDTEKYKSFYKIIDVCMKIEYTTLISFQVYDLDKIQGDILYRLASPSDKVLTFSGEEKPCKGGELVLVDQETTLHSVYYGNNRSKSISNETKTNLVRIMCVPDIPTDFFQLAIDLFSKAVPHQQNILLNTNSESAII